MLRLFYLTILCLGLAVPATAQTYIPSTTTIARKASSYASVESVASKLRRLASQAAANNPLDAAVASGVTMTTATAANGSQTKQYLPNTTPNVFAVHGGTARIYNTSFWAFPVSSVAPATDGNLNGYFSDTPDAQAMGWEVAFVTDDPLPTIRVSGFNAGNSNFRVIVDGQYVTKAATTYAQTGLSYVQLDFGGIRQPRHIRFRSMGGNLFGGVLVGALSTVWAPDESDVIRVAFTGDSYSDRLGYTGSTVLPDAMWCHVVGNLLGWRDVRQVAVGGTGYLNNGGVRSTIQNQIPRWIGIKPDVVVFAAGYNDSIASPSALTSAALLALQTVRASLPDAAIIVVGPWPGAGGQSAAVLSKEAAILSAVQQFSDPLTMFVPQENVDTPWISGTGYVGATNGSGNSDLYISSDTIHPSEAGHIHLGRRAASAIRDAITHLPN
jgi:lysophospholipase L1-like esterase